MSQENVEVIHRGLEALVRRDTDAARELMREHLAPDFVFESALTGRVYSGPEEALDLATDLWGTLDYVPAIEEVIDAGEHVVVMLRISGRGERSGVPVSQHIAIVYTFEHQRIVRGKSFTSRAEALEAAGVEE